MPLSDREGPDDRSRLALGSALAYLIPVSVGVLVVGLTTGSAPIAMLSIFLPFLCLQDIYRHIFFRQRRPELAAVLDGIWVVISAAGWVLISSSGSPVVAVAVWGVGGALGAVVGAVISKSTPAGPRPSVRWWLVEARSLGGFLAVDQALSATFQQVLTLGLAGILGSADIGRLRGAQIILGPVGLILTAFQAFILPRIAGSQSALTSRQAVITSVAAGGFTYAGAAVLWLLSPWLIPLVFGESIELPPVLLIAVGVAMTIRATSIGPMLQLKALQQGAPIAGARLVTGLMSLPMVLGAAVLFGLVAAVWAQSVPALAFVVLLYVALMRRSPRTDDLEVGWAGGRG
jgi:O-antigen/teichoic acid export membrane protein